MRKVYITFGGSAYDDTVERTVKDAPGFGVDDVWVYDDRWLKEQEFYKLNIWLWRHRGVKNENGGRGFGWFAWKPFIILNALSRVQDGDIILFTDGDTYPVHDLTVLFDTCAKLGGVMLFAANGWLNNQWCKKDCYVVMAQDEERYRNCQAGVARFMLFQKGPWHVQQFLMEWLAYCLNPRATTFDPSVLGAEYKGFEEHRTEQAIMTLLAHKYGHKLFREACQFGAGFPEDKDLYPTLFKQESSSQARLLHGSRFANIP